MGLYSCVLEDINKKQNKKMSIVLNIQLWWTAYLIAHNQNIYTFQKERPMWVANTHTREREGGTVGFSRMFGEHRSVFKHTDSAVLQRFL